MAHRMSTSEMYYKASQSGSAAVKAHQLIMSSREIVANKDVHSEAEENNQSEINEEIEVVESDSIDPVIQELLDTCNKANQAEQTTSRPVPETVITRPEVPETVFPEPSRFGPKSKFDKEPIVMAEVQRLFGRNIANNYVNKKDAFEIYKGNQILKIFKFQALYDKMRRMYPKNCIAKK
ncbi:uncharacterized protein LOC117107004 isoform X1 [Anneissia japonica]|uniref:uncharacterized protein LOC117107004 isoform X1 n=1 Tax=Anneissia japonica TaxID=1529436 RepID=UPI00142598BB|nr:uncharacterized protein LOC117107004 isoform X1 [Anneissia japonica]